MVAGSPTGFYSNNDMMSESTQSCDSITNCAASLTCKRQNETGAESSVYQSQISTSAKSSRPTPRRRVIYRSTCARNTSNDNALHSSLILLTFTLTQSQTRKRHKQTEDIKENDNHRDTLSVAFSILPSVQPHPAIRQSAITTTQRTFNTGCMLVPILGDDNSIPVIIRASAVRFADA